MHATLSKGIVRRYGDAIDTLQNVLYWFFADVNYPRPFLLSGAADELITLPMPAFDRLKRRSARARDRFCRHGRISC